MFQFDLEHNLGHFEANLFDRAEIVMQAIDGETRPFTRDHRTRPVS